MATFNKFHQFVEGLAKGEHNFTNDASAAVTIALTNAANPPLATNEVLANLTQIAYTNLSTRVVTGISAEQTAGVVNFTVNNHVLTASGAVAPFQYVVFYNASSAGNQLIGWWDNGTEVTLNNPGETFTVSFTGNWATLQ